MEGLADIIKKLEKRLRDLEGLINLRKITIPSDGYIIVQSTAVDPATPTNGQIWYNSTSNTFKCYQGGVIKTFTVS